MSDLLSSDLLPYEKEVLTKLLDGDHPVLINLRTQISRADITERIFTGVGFTVDMIVSEDLALPGKPNFVISDVIAKVPNVKYGINFLLFIREGLIKFLEGCTFGEDWPNEISQFKIDYIKDGFPNTQRDLEALKEKLPVIT